MPVEIRKLVIQAKVADGALSAKQKTTPLNESKEEEYQRLLEDCVKEVLKILKREKSR